MTTPDLPGHVVMFLDAAEEHARYALDRAQAALGGAEAEAARDYHAEAGRLQADAGLKAEHARQLVADAEAELAKWAERGDGAVSDAYNEARPGPARNSHGQAQPAEGRGGTTGA